MYDEHQQSIELALIASQRSETIGFCLSSEKMTDLVDKDLNPVEYNDAIEHLDTCKSCYNQWLKLSLGKLHQNKQQETKKLNSFKILSIYSLLIAIHKWVSNNRLKTMTFSLMLFISFFLYFLKSPQTSVIQNSINDTYTAISSCEFNVDGFIRRISLKDKSEVLGISDSDIKKASRQAFKKGLISARNIILNKNTTISHNLKWTKHPLNIYFWLGQWSLIVRTACISDFEIPEFWEKQKRILLQIKDKYSVILDKEGVEYLLVYEKLSDILLYINAPNINENQKDLIYNKINDVIKYLTSDV